MGEIYKIYTQQRLNRVPKTNFEKSQKLLFQYRANIIVHKFWLISVFVTNAKGGDFWHQVKFFISDNTYSDSIWLPSSLNSSVFTK